MRNYFFLISLIVFFSCKQKEDYSKITVLQYYDSNFADKGDTVEIGLINKEKKFTSRDVRDNGISHLSFFDNKGKLISSVIKYNDSFAVQVDKKLDNFGLEVELNNFEIGRSGDTITLLIENQYNADSTFVISSIFDKTHNKISRVDERAYDAKKNIISLISKDPNNHQILQKKVFVYDNRSNNIETSLFDSVGNLKEKDIYVYNEKDQLVKESHFENGNLDHYSIYFYEGDRRMRGIRGGNNQKERYLKYFYE